MLKFGVSSVVAAAAFAAAAPAKAETIALWLSQDGVAWTQEVAASDPTDFYQPQIKNFGAFSIISSYGSDLPGTSASQTYSINAQVSINNPGPKVPEPPVSAAGGTVYVLVVENDIAPNTYTFSAASVNAQALTGGMGQPASQSWTVTQAIFVDGSNAAYDINPADQMEFVPFGTTSGAQTCPGAGGNVFKTSPGSQYCDIANQAGRTFTDPFAINMLFKVDAPASTGDYKNYGFANLSNQVTYQSGAVPEPATWAMFGLGFAALATVGVARRHRAARFAL